MIQSQNKQIIICNMSMILIHVRKYLGKIDLFSFSKSLLIIQTFYKFKCEGTLFYSTSYQILPSALVDLVLSFSMLVKKRYKVI